VARHASAACGLRCPPAITPPDQHQATNRARTATAAPRREMGEPLGRAAI